MKRVLVTLYYLISLHLLVLAGLSTIRLVQFFQNISMLQPKSVGKWDLLAHSMLRGLWFDNVTACYISILPLAILLISSLFSYFRKPLFYFFALFLTIFHLIAFAISAANLPYFSYFFKNINSSIFNWTEYGSTTAGMIFGEPSYLVAFGVFLAVSAGYIYLSRSLFKQATNTISLITNKRRYGSWRMSAKRRTIPNTFVYLTKAIALNGIVIGACLFGIRGRTGYNPIRVSAAYHCNDPFLNQLGLNPAHYLLITTLDDGRSENKRLALMNDNDAIAAVKASLSVNQTSANGRFIRPVKYEESSTRQNVVLIFMESMSAKLMQSYGQKQAITPFLDSLRNHSISFDRIYSSGIHTNHGLYATLYSFPTILKRNAMKGSDIPQYSGLPTTLASAGYQNLFFMTHEAQYDNMNAFLRTNGYHEIYAEENYPDEEIVNSFGVPDHFLFDYALPILNERGKGKKPFFATLLTISNHPPYVLPDWFKAKSETIEKQIVEYADHCLQQFMVEASKQPWFDNTLFVFVGDHGKLVGKPEAILPESYNHVPLMFYSKGIEAKKKDAIGGQIDIASTILGMLRIPHERHHLGVDLLNETRATITYTADDLIASRSKDRLWIYSPGTDKSYYYALDSIGSIQREAAADSLLHILKQDAFSTLQTTEAIVDKGNTFLTE